MNEQQPYEKHLADKLKQLPLPDADQSWEQMRLLLDKEMPRGGSGSNGYGRWWMIGMSVIIILLGIWFGGKEFSSTNDEPTATVAKLPASAKETSNSSGVSLSKTSTEKDEGDKGARQPQNDPSTGSVDKTIALNEGNNIKGKEESATDKSVTIINETSDAGIKKTSSSDVNLARLSADNNKNVVETKKNQTSKNPGLKSQLDESEKSLNRENNSANNDDKFVGPGIQKRPGSRDNAGTVRLADPIAKERPVRSWDIAMKVNDIAAFVSSPAIRFADSIETDYATHIQAGNSNDRLTKVNKKSNRRNSNSLTASKPATSKSAAATHERTFAVGLSMPLGFPLGDQNALGYNINAKGNTLLDYLPAPHLQYHFNEKLYLQSEFQFQSPQYIQPILLYQHKTDIPMTNRVHYQSIYAQKLYYFNFPLGIHYSPFKNFYMGTGLQFSSLLSGVALHDERTSYATGPVTGDTIISQRYLKFKDDTISQKLSSSELRLGLDANYYWHKFTVGLRYNQALSNYVNLRLSVNSPLLQDKNKSLQFYLRYNLWEDRKRKNGKRTLSAK